MRRFSRQDRAAASMVFHVALKTTRTAAQMAGAVGGEGNGAHRHAIPSALNGGPEG